MYPAVRENLATLLTEADAVGRGLPRYVARDFSRYLDCGQLANGFARVRCDTCGDELQVAFSCRGRGVCPSCNAKPLPIGYGEECSVGCATGREYGTILCNGQCDATC